MRVNDNDRNWNLGDGKYVTFQDQPENMRCEVRIHASASFMEYLLTRLMQFFAETMYFSSVIVMVDGGDLCVFFKIRDEDEVGASLLRRKLASLIRWRWFGMHFSPQTEELPGTGKMPSSIIVGDTYCWEIKNDQVSLSREIADDQSQYALTAGCSVLPNLCEQSAELVFLNAIESVRIAKSPNGRNWIITIVPSGANENLVFRDLATWVSNRLSM